MSSQEDMNVVRRNLAGGEEEEDGANFAQAPSPAPSNQQGAVKWVTSALVGVVFGIALEKGRGIVEFWSFCTGVVSGGNRRNMYEFEQSKLHRSSACAGNACAHSCFQAQIRCR